MLKRPSSRRKSAQQGIILNLVPMLDAMVTLIGFLLFTMSFLALSSIESPFPELSASSVQEKLKERPLQLTLSLRDGEAEIWSPFEKFAPKKIPHNPDGTPDLRAIHGALVEVKQKFPLETKIVFVPFAGASYDVLISVMDAVRMLDPTDPPLFVRNEKTGTDISLKTLFPEVIFGNLLGDS
jgi:biopolymer transport protein ExbD